MCTRSIIKYVLLFIYPINEIKYHHFIIINRREGSSFLFLQWMIAWIARLHGQDCQIARLYFSSFFFFSSKTVPGIYSILESFRLPYFTPLIKP